MLTPRIRNSRKRPVHARDRHVWCRRFGGDLGQQAVVVTGNDPARIGRATIQTNAHACGFAIGGNAAIIGDKVVLRVFCGDPRLQRMARQHHIFWVGLPVASSMVLPSAIRIWA